MSDTAVIRCPGCKKKYRWQDKFAGRKVRCGCGFEMRMPSDASGEVTDGSVKQAATPAKPAKTRKPAPEASEAGYELDLDDHHMPSGVAAKAGQKCPGCNVEMKEGAIVCMNCGYHLQEGKKMEVAVNAPSKGLPKSAQVPQASAGFQSMLDRAAKQTENEAKYAQDLERETFMKEKIFPFIFLGVGIALHVLSAFVLLDVTAEVERFLIPPAAARMAIFVGNMIGMVIGIPFLLIGVFFTAKLFGTAYGPLFTGILKLFTLAAMSSGASVCAGALLLMMTEGMQVPGMDFLQFLAGITVFGILALWMFDMDITEVTVLYLVGVFLPGLVMMFFAMALILGLF